MRVVDEDLPFVVLQGLVRPGGDNRDVRVVEQLRRAFQEVVQRLAPPVAVQRGGVQAGFVGGGHGAVDPLLQLRAGDAEAVVERREHGGALVHPDQACELVVHGARRLLGAGAQVGRHRVAELDHHPRALVAHAPRERHAEERVVVVVDVLREHALAGPGPVGAEHHVLRHPLVGDVDRDVAGILHAQIAQGVADGQEDQR